MASRTAVAASMTAALVFSSLLLSNLVLYTGADQNLRLAALDEEEGAFASRALAVRSVALLDLLDGAQALLSSGTFYCSNSSAAVAALFASENVSIGWGGLRAQSRLATAPDVSITDNMTSLSPYAGSNEGWTNMAATSLVRGESPDGSVGYDKREVHLLSLPLRLGALTEQCDDSSGLASSVLSGLGAGVCNSSLVTDAMARVEDSASSSGAADGFGVSVSYASPRPCEVDYWVTADQASVAGPEGPFTFVEEQTGSVYW